MVNASYDRVQGLTINELPVLYVAVLRGPNLTFLDRPCLLAGSVLASGREEAPSGAGSGAETETAAANQDGRRARGGRPR